MSVEVSPAGILGFEVRSISGEPIFLGDFAGKVVLVVNTASRLRPSTRACKNCMKPSARVGWW